MPLSDAKIRNVKPKSKSYKLTDGEGLFLLVHPNGSKYWRFKYRFRGREKNIAFGVYPEVSLMDARDKRAAARKAVAAGLDPAEVKKEAKREAIQQSADSFEAIAREWLEKQKTRWGENTARIHRKRLETYAFPTLGPRSIGSLKAPAVLDMLRAIETHGTLETAHRVKQDCGKIFMYAIATARAERNPVPDLNGALEAPPAAKNHSYLKAGELREYLGKLEVYDGEMLTQLALRLIFLTFVRTLELRAAEWAEIDFDQAEWRIPPERMKMKRLHIVPLSKQAVAILHSLKKLSGGKRYIFPNEHNLETFMSENTMIYALYRMGYRSRATVHGFRSTASTILNENGFRPDVIERQLAHIEPNKVRSAYNHAEYLPERRKMMQWWGDYLETVQTGPK